MKHENEPEGLPVCNFCDKEYDPHDKHICAGNMILPREKLDASYLGEDGTTVGRTVPGEFVKDDTDRRYATISGYPAIEHHPRCHTVQYGSSDCDCEAKARSSLDCQSGGDKALTYDDGKPPLANLPWAAIGGLSRVQAYGHSKYKDFNNYRKGMEVSRNLSCALRHIKEYLEGHDVDEESGCHPLEHAMARVAFVLQNIAEGKAIDDRYIP